MGFRASLGQPVRYQEVVLRARPTTWSPPPFAAQALGLVILTLVGAIAMSHLDAVVGPSLREGALTLAMPPRASASALLGITSARTIPGEPAYVDAQPAVISAATDVRERAAPVVTSESAVVEASPVVTVVSAALRPSLTTTQGRPTSPVVTVVSVALRPSPVVALARPVVTVVSVAPRPSQAVVVGKPARQRADARFKLTPEHAKASKTRTRARGRNDHKSSSARRSA